MSSSLLSSASSSQSISSLELLCHVATSTRTTPKSEDNLSILNYISEDSGNNSSSASSPVISDVTTTSSSTTLSELTFKNLPFPCSGYFETCFCFAFLQRFHSLLGWVFIPIDVFEDYICSLESNMSMNSKPYRWFRQWMLNLLDLIEPSSPKFSSLSWEKRLKSILPSLAKSEHGSFLSQDNTNETFSFLELGLKQKLQIMKALCEYALFSEPIQAHLKTTKDPSLLRLLPLGYDQLHQAYYAFDHCPRLYRSPSSSFDPSSSSLLRWELLCVNLEDWEPLLSLCTRSLDSNERELGQALSRFHSDYVAWFKEQKANLEPQNLVASQFVTHQPTQRILKRLGTTLADQSQFDQLSKTRLRSKLDPQHNLVASSSKLNPPLKKHSKSSSLSTNPLSSKLNKSKTQRVSKLSKPQKHPVPNIKKIDKTSIASLLSNPTRTVASSSLLSPTSSSSSSSYSLVSSPSNPPFLPSSSPPSSLPYSRSPSPFLSYADAFLPPPIMLHPRMNVAPPRITSFSPGF